MLQWIELKYPIAHILISILEPRCPYQGLYFTSDWQNTLAYHGVEHTSQNMRRASQRIDNTHVCCVNTYQDLVHCVSRQVLLKPQGVCSRACFNYIAIFVYSVGPVNDLSFTLKIQKPVFFIRKYCKHYVSIFYACQLHVCCLCLTSSYSRLYSSYMKIGPALFALRYLKTLWAIAWEYHHVILTVLRDDNSTSHTTLQSKAIVFIIGASCTKCSKRHTHYKSIHKKPQTWSW